MKILSKNWRYKRRNQRRRINCEIMYWEKRCHLHELCWHSELIASKWCSTWLDAATSDCDQQQSDACGKSVFNTRDDSTIRRKNHQFWETKSYIFGIFNVGTEPKATTTLPIAYTSDKYMIVLNFPSKLSDKSAPKIHMKYIAAVNKW